MCSFIVTDVGGNEAIEGDYGKWVQNLSSDRSPNMMGLKRTGVRDLLLVYLAKRTLVRPTSGIITQRVVDIASQDDESFVSLISKASYTPWRPISHHS